MNYKQLFLFIAVCTSSFAAAHRKILLRYEPNHIAINEILKKARAHVSGKVSALLDKYKNCTNQKEKEEIVEAFARYYDDEGDLRLHTYASDMSAMLKELNEKQYTDLTSYFVKTCIQERKEWSKPLLVAYRDPKTHKDKENEIDSALFFGNAPMMAALSENLGKRELLYRPDGTKRSILDAMSNGDNSMREKTADILIAIDQTILWDTNEQGQLPLEEMLQWGDERMKKWLLEHYEVTSIN